MTSPSQSMRDESTRIHAMSFDRRDKSSRPLDLSDLERDIADPNVFTWIDIHGPDIAALNQTLERLGIDLVLVSHFDVPEVLPRIVERHECLAFYAYEVEDPELHLDTAQELRLIEFVRLLVVLSEDYVVTFHKRDVEAVRVVREAAEESFRLWGKTPGFVVFLVLQRCLYDYAHLNLANDNFLDDLEERVLTGDREELAADIATSGQNIVTLKKLVTSLQIVLMLLASKRSLFISEESRPFYRDMLDNSNVVRGAIDSSRDLLDGILASVQARAAQRTGDIARVLTVVSAIILPLSLVAGIYGMNFRRMPELEHPYGYFIVLGAMGVMGLGLLWLFHRLGWIGRRWMGQRERARFAALAPPDNPRASRVTLPPL